MILLVSIALVGLLTGCGGSTDIPVPATRVKTPRPSAEAAAASRESIAVAVVVRDERSRRPAGVDDSDATAVPTEIRDPSAVAFADATSPTAAVPSPDWPRWRGPKGDGVADHPGLPVRWSRTDNVAWSAELPGWGTSSPVVLGDRVFVTSQVEGDGKKSLWTLCFSRRDGRELWRHDFGFGYDQKTHETSNLACITPAAVGDAVYVGFGNAELARYSLDGKLEWVTRLVPIVGRSDTAWGFGSSPIVLPDGVLLPYEHQGDPCYFLGLDQRTGEIAWKVRRPLGANYATPLVLEHGGRPLIVATGKHRLTAFDARTREQLWQYGEGEGAYNGEIVGSPVAGDGLVFTQLWRQSRIHALRLDAKGGEPTPLWVSAKPGPEEPSLLYYRGLLYAQMDNGIVVCFDALTGEELYRERLGGSCTSSPVAGSGRVYLCNHLGQTFVLRAGREFELLATNELGERFSASPAISGRQLILRTISHLYCIGTETEPAEGR